MRSNKPVWQCCRQNAHIKFKLIFLSQGESGIPRTTNKEILFDSENVNKITQPMLMVKNGTHWKTLWVKLTFEFIAHYI